MKNHIIEATNLNNGELFLSDLNTFIGILILSAFNKRKAQRDYWSNDLYLCCQIISSAMSRDKFEKIKSKIKYSKLADFNASDKG